MLQLPKPEELVNSFGYIVVVKYPNFDIDKSKMIKAFQDAAIPEEFVPTERIPIKAFKKAVKESLNGEENFMVRPIQKKNDIVTSGLVKENKFEEQKDLKYDVRNVLTFNPSSESIIGKTDFCTESVKEGYKEQMETLGNAEMKAKVDGLLQVSMAIEVLCGKCVFVPATFKPMLEKIISVCGNVNSHGAGVEFSWVGVDNGTATRTIIVINFKAQTTDQLDKELEFCVTQRKNFEDGKIKFLRPSTFKKQLDRLDKLKERLKIYINILNLTPEEDKEIVEKIDRVHDEISKNITIGQNSSQKKRKGDAVSLNIANASS